VFSLAWRFVTANACLLQGINWLFSSFLRKRNVILGDEMGLGKTAQALVFLECEWLKLV
jgi:SNF2 family DNA or RNA helicase